MPVELPPLDDRAACKMVREVAVKIRKVAALAPNLDIQISFSGMNASEVASFELSAPVLHGVGDLLEMMSKGLSVVMAPKVAEMTTAQAAKFLGVSRNFIVSESDRGNLICRKVGKHRRYKPEVLEQYQRLHAGRERMRENLLE